MKNVHVKEKGKKKHDDKQFHYNIEYFHTHIYTADKYKNIEKFLIYMKERTRI